MSSINPYMKISVNDGPWHIQAYDPNLKVSEIDPHVVAMWVNLRKALVLTGPETNLTRHSTLRELSVTPSSLIYIYNDQYPFLTPNMDNFVPGPIRIANEFIEDACAAFERQKMFHRLLALFPKAAAAAAAASSSANAPQIQSIGQGIHILSNTPSRLGERDVKFLADELYNQFINGNFDAFALDCPEIVETFKANTTMTPEEFHKIFVDYKNDLVRRDALINDPTSEEGQALLQQRIHRNRIHEMYEQAFDHHPENQVPVTMLYVNLSINGVPAKAFIDSGAQLSIISLECAQRCNLTDIIDRRIRKIAKGIGGTDQFVGRIHLCDVKVEDAHFMCQFEVASNRDMDILIGLDVLKQHRCSINLANNCLEFPNGTSTPFLQAHEIEEHIGRLENDPNPDEKMDTSS